VRPRPRRTVTPPAPANGTHPAPEPRVEIPEPLRDLTHALEDLHTAAKGLRLPPMRVEWQESADPTEDPKDPERLALKRYVDTMFSDYEGVRSGPIAIPVSEMPPPADPHSFLVGNLIRPGTTVMLAGPPGAAKSWASRQLALAAAGGRQMYLEHYPIERPLNVLVVDEDNGPDEEWRRDETLLRFLELDRSQVGSVRRVSLEGVQLDQERWQRWLRGQIRLHDIDLTILDPISEMHGGKELREDPSFRSMLAFLKRLKVDFPALATVIVHHTRKRDPKAAVGSATLEDVRGQWGQTPDVVAMLIPMGERRSTWEVHKRVPHSSLILEQVAEGEPGEGALRFVADESTQRTKAMANDAKVIDAVREGLETFPDLLEHLGMAKSTLHRVLKRLVGARVVQLDGTRYSIPEDDE
jgi:hypothetical protein